MKTQLHLLFLLCVTWSYAQPNTTLKNDQSKEAISVVDFKTLAPLLQDAGSNKVHIVNFWAMWCAPCVKELPLLQDYQTKHPDTELLLVSMDFPENIEKSLLPFLKKKGITAKVILLDEPDANSWIDKIDPNWSGSLPFTIIYNNENRSYFERDFKDATDLENAINSTITP
jgi:thiol-disulfide isomerase/thioredoxin